MPPPLKPIHYRGGLVTFSIPAHWTEEYEKDGGGTFYDSADESLTLRLSVMTMTPPKPLRLEDAPAVLASMSDILQAPAGPAPDIEPLPHDQAICFCPPRRETENGEAIELHTWGLLRVVAPTLVRLAIFTTTVARRAGADRATETLAILREQVRSAVISPAPRLKLPTPWWKRIFGVK